MLTKEQRDFLLLPKALPTSTHGFNLRRILPQVEWDRLRKKVYAKASYKCELCGAEDKKLEAHEVWRFDFPNHVQVLETLVALCMHCHRIQHALLLKLQVDQGAAHCEYTIKHFNKLTNNHFTESQFFAEATKNFQKLDQVEWDVYATKEFEELLK